MTVNQETHELLTLDEVKEISAFIKEHRRRPGPLDIAINLEIPSDRSQAVKMLQAYAEAEATWCVVLARDTVAEYRELIRCGPPKLSL